mgnify:CR=1 FL=1
MLIIDARSGLVAMPNELPQTQAEKLQLVSTVEKRFIRSSSYTSPWREEWVRYYKIWRTMLDKQMDSDEPNSFLPYAYGIIEKLTSRTVEAIIKTRLPVKPRHIGDVEKAEKFSNITRNYYDQSEYQDQYAASMKEMRITGSRWEIDDWANRWAKGKMWKKVPQKGILDKIQTMAGKVIPGLQSEYEFQAETEVEIDVPLEVGFRTKFPSVFDVYPEPDKKRVDDMAWLIVDEGEVALDDLRKEFYVDSQGEKRPVYDLTEIESEYPNHVPGAIAPVRKWQSGTDYGRLSRDAVAPTEGTVDKSSSSDMDRVWVCTMYEPNRIITILNGRYLVRLVKDPWHIPRIPARIERHVVDPQFLYGLSVLQPIEDQIYELNDIHNLSMSNWIRIINKMMAIHIDGVPFPDDFKPRAGGKIRVRADMDVRQAIMPIEQTDVTPSMVGMEANTKGSMEWASGVSDFSPGPRGVKQGHDTLGGLLEIEQQLSVTFTTWQRQSLGNRQKQMESMEHFFSQYAFEKRPYRVYRDSGATVLAEFNKDDIFTDGRGFDYIIEIDPTFGNDAVQRQQLMILFDLSLKYMAARAQMKDQTMEEVKINVLFRNILTKFGFTDPSNMFKLPNNAMSPDDELAVIMQGGTVRTVNGEDKINHVLSHINQLNDPNIQKAVESGKADPDTIRKLQLHLEETKASIVGILQDPELSAEIMKNREMGGAIATA